MKGYVLITGATAGFGEACARIFACNGWNLIITGRRAERLEQLSHEIKQQYSVRVETLSFDIRSQEAVDSAIHSLGEDVKQHIHILINNAGLAVGRSSIEDGVIDDWERMIDTNVKGLLYISRAVIPLMIANESGHIFNIASIAGKEVYAGGNVYCATKHAVDALSKSMRIDLVEHGIKVTNIAPGAAETEFSLVRFKGDERVAKSVYEGFDPLVAQDIAETIYFVATRPSHVNINDLVIVPAAQASSTIIHRK